MIFTLISLCILFLSAAIFFYLQLWQQRTLSRKQNSELIRINNDMNFQSNLWNDLKEIIIIHSLSGSIIKTNRVFHEILGYSEDQSGNQLFLNYIYSDYITDYEIYMENLINNHYTSGVMHLKDSENKEHIFEYSARVFKNEQFSYVQWLGQDKTKFLVLQKNLNTAEKKFDILFDLIPDSGLILDVKGLVIHSSKNIKNLLGYNASEIIGMYFPNLIIPIIRDDSQIEFEIEKLEVQNTELLLKHINGSQVNVLVYSQPFYDEKDNFIGIFVICYNQSARKKLEEEKNLFESHFQQRQKVEILGMLAGGISHDFNNILSAILGFADIASEELSGDHPARESVEEIISAGNYGRDLVRQILLFSRKAEQVFRPVKIKPVLKQSVKLLRAILPSNIKLIVKITLDDETIATDPVQIHQILFNLFTNAIYAMKNKMPGVLRFTAERFEGGGLEHHNHIKPATYIKLQVQDNGCGINSEQLDKIYVPFYTTKEEGDGSGIGLSIVKDIVTGHGGKIFAESTPGRGSTFTVLLPSNNVQTEHLTEINQLKIKGHGKILVADKNQSVLKTTKKVLTRLGYQVNDTIDPDEAIREIQKNPRSYDLVITDHLIPNDSIGYLAQLIHEIRSDLPIIILTGHLEESTLDFRKEDYIFDYLDKPVNPVLLSRSVAAALKSAKDKISAF